MYLCDVIVNQVSCNSEFIVFPNQKSRFIRTVLTGKHQWLVGVLTSSHNPAPIIRGCCDGSLGFGKSNGDTVVTPFLEKAVFRMWF